MNLRTRISSRTLQLLILGTAILSFLPEFRSSVIPAHDARQCLSAFQVFYSNWFNHSDIPLWLPFGRYGTNSVLLMMYLTPVNFFVGGLGKLFGMTDVLLLFKISVLLEFLLYVIGTVKLSLLLFEKYESVLLVGIGAIFSFSWMMSLDANFHAFYMFPFIFRYMILFLTTGSVRHLGIAGVFCVFSCVGNVPYHPPLLTLMLTLFSVAMLAQGSFRGKRLAFSFWDAAPFLVVFAGAVAHVGTYLLNFNGLHSYSAGRDPETSVVSKDVYLTYAGVTKLSSLGSEYLHGKYTNGDNTFYLGLAPLLLVVFAFLRSQRKECLSFAFVATFLIAFSFGGWTAEVAYYFPGMSLYRHVGLIFGPARFFLLIISGFALDSFLAESQSLTPSIENKGWRTVFSHKLNAGLLRILIVEILIMESVCSLFSSVAPWEYFLFPRESANDWLIYRVLGYITLAAISGWWIIVSRTNKSSPRRVFATYVILLGFTLDIASYRARGMMDWPAASAEDIASSKELFRPRLKPFVNERMTPQRLLDDNEQLRFFADHAGSPQVTYVHAWEVVGLDPCEPRYRTDFLSKDVAALFERRNIEFSVFPPSPLLRVDDNWLMQAVGRDVPKLRLVPLTNFNSELLEPDPVVPYDGNLGLISDIEFSSNWLKANVFVSASTPVRLYYADTYHPGWRALVNGHDSPIDKTNAAFKSVVLQPGPQSVEFRYFNGWGSVCLYLLGMISVGLVCFIVIDLTRSPVAQDASY